MLLLPVHKPVQGWRHGWRMGVHSLDIKKPWIIKLRQSTFCKHLEGGGGNSGTYQGILNMRLGGGLKSVITKYLLILKDVILGHCLNKEICPIPNSTFKTLSDLHLEDIYCLIYLEKRSILANFFVVSALELHKSCNKREHTISTQFSAK